MRRSRQVSWVVAIAWSALAAASGAATASARAGEPVSLAGTTTLEGRSTGYVDVRVPRQVALDPAFYLNRSFAIRRAGPVAGMVLRQDVAPGEKRATVVAFLPSATACYTPTAPRPCRDNDGIWTGWAHVRRDDEGNLLLPAGDYRLYLVASEPARVTLTLGKLTGSVGLAPAVPTPAKVIALPRRDTYGLDNVAVFGDFGELRSDGLLLGELTLRTDAHAASRHEHCLYHHRPPPDPGRAFQPGCSLGAGIYSGQALVASAPVPGPGYVATGVMLPVASGTYGFGGNLETGGLVESVGGSAAWISYEPEPGVVPPPTTKPPPTGAGDDRRGKTRRTRSRKCKKGRSRGGERRSKRCPRKKRQGGRRRGG